MTQERLFHRIVKTSGLASAGKIGAKLLGLGHYLLLFFYLLGTEGFGRYAWILAFVGIFSGLAEGGVSGILVRELNRTENKDRRGELFSGALLLLFVQCFFFWLLAVGALLYLPLNRNPQDIRWGVLYSTVILFSPYSACEAVFRARLDIRLPVLVNLVRYILFLIALLPGTPIDSVGEVLAVWWGLMAAGTLVVAIGAYKKFPLAVSGAIDSARFLFGQSWPLFFTRMATVAYYRIDQVMIGIFFEPAQLGWYASAVKLTESAHLVPTVLLEGIYPALTRVWGESKEAFIRSFARVWKLFLGLSALVVLGGTWLVPIVLSWEKAEQLVPALPSLLILSGAEGFIFLNLLLFQTLIAADRQRNLIGVTASMMLGNIGLNLLFFTLILPDSGHIGAAWATLLTEALGVGMQMRLFHRYLPESGVARQLGVTLILTSLLALFLSLRFAWGIVGQELHTAVLFLALLGVAMWLRDEIRQVKAMLNS